MTASEQHPWHALPEAEALQLLNVRKEEGLALAEAAHRLVLYGPNQLPAGKRTPHWLSFLLQFHQPLIYILLAATAVSVILGEWVDASVIFGVVLVNAVIGYLQETKAEKAIDALARMVITQATVCRSGEIQRIPSHELVPGDIVFLQSGDRVPADLRLLRSKNLQIEEAALTGESLPVEKFTAPLSMDTVLADRRNLAFTGTLVTSGQGYGVVFGTGERTEMGRIAGLIDQADDIQTPLTRKIASFSRLLLYVILGLALVTFAVGLFRGENWQSMFMASVALAVSAIPEGLPAALTITLAIGVSRMAKQRAIIRKLLAVETLGSTTVICSDKTGTLTQNQMTVQEVYAGGRRYQVTGSGYDPAGAFHSEGEPVMVGENMALVETLGAGLLCNDSRLVTGENGRTGVEGDPTEAALIVAARKAGIRGLEQRLPRVESIPFESEYQYMATLHGGVPAYRVIYMKGSIEALASRCDSLLRPDGTVEPIARDEVIAEANAMAARGLRVLAFARLEVPVEHESLEHEHVSGGLTFLGLQGKLDPPRPEAIEAVARCRTAGIAVKMITGDHLLTARAIAEAIGLEEAKRIEAVNGADLAMMDDARFSEIAERAVVFARVAPEQKLRLVRALQSRGHIVAMTGDGVNDAPALKQADIGTAMGITGTDVSKEAADMILTDDNFASIEAAVEEGRGVFDNLTKFIVWTLPTNFGEGLVILFSVLAGTALPILPVQILWINMTTAILLGLMLVFEPKEEDIMRRPPRDPSAPILNKALQFRILLVSMILLAGCFAVFNWELRSGASLEEARTAAVNVFVMGELFYLFNCRSFAHSAWSVGFFSNRWLIAGAVAMIGLQMLYTYAPLMNRVFGSSPLAAGTWLQIVGVGFSVSLLVGLEKIFLQRRRNL